MQQSIPHITSRIHPLKDYFIKRDDELPHGGSKSRKYASLLPAILDSGHKSVVLKGGKRSNHIYYFSKLLAEHGITVGTEGFVVEEGGSQKESIPGALTLAQDIPEGFDHIVIDAGSGMMAAALLHGVKAHVHILQLAPLDFKAKYEEWFGPFPHHRCTLHFPSKWRSFGSFTPPPPPLYRPVHRRDRHPVRPDLLRQALLFPPGDNPRTKRLLTRCASRGFTIFCKLTPS